MLLFQRRPWASSRPGGYRHPVVSSHLPSARTQQPVGVLSAQQVGRARKPSEVGVKVTQVVFMSKAITSCFVGVYMYICTYSYKSFKKNTLRLLFFLPLDFNGNGQAVTETAAAGLDNVFVEAIIDALPVAAVGDDIGLP